MTAAPMLDAALELAAEGLPVFPCHYPLPNGRCSCGKPHKGKAERDIGKHPMTIHGLSDASIDPNTVRSRWQRTPSANVAVAVPPGWAVLDIDGPEGEAAIQAIGEGLPQTAEVMTSRGRHLWYRTPADFHARSRNHMLASVDVRAAGGYVIAPPSVHRSGHVYSWTVPLEHAVEAPGWLLDLIGETTTIPVAAPIEAAAWGDDLRERLELAIEADPRLGRTWRRERTDLGDDSDSGYCLALANGLVAAGWTDPEVVAALREWRRANGQAQAARAGTRATVAKARKAAEAAPGEGDPDSHHLTDLGNAERFLDQHGKIVRYCALWSRWLAWDGQRWAPDSTRRVIELGASTARRIWAEAAVELDNDKRKKIGQHAARSENRQRIEAAVSLASSFQSLAVLPEDLDRDPWILNVENGTLDLRTGMLLPHEQAHLVTKLAPVTFDPAAEAPVWEAFFRSSLPDQDVREFMQRFIGYALTGNVSEQCLLFLWGSGANGKSTFLNAVLHVLGGYGRQAPPDLLIQTSGERHPTELADLQGMRFVAASEVDEGRRWAEARLKLLTGGEKRHGAQDAVGLLLVRADAQARGGGEPQACGAGAGPRDVAPAAPGPVHGYDPRECARPAPRRETQGRGRRDSALGRRWLSGVAARRAPGAGRSAGGDLGVPGRHGRARRLPRRRAHAGERGPHTEQAMRERYQYWCDRNGFRPMNTTAFSLRLQEHGFTQYRTGSGRGWDGVLLIDHTRGDEVTGYTEIPQSPLHEEPQGKVTRK